MERKEAIQTGLVASAGAGTLGVVGGVLLGVESKQCDQESIKSVDECPDAIQHYAVETGAIAGGATLVFAASAIALYSKIRKN